MKIEPTRGTNAPSASRRASGAGSEGFALPTGETKAAASAAPSSSVAAVSGLLALQFEGGSRRQRQTRRAAAALDTLDRLQAALLSGGESGADLSQLAAHLADREPTGDAGLDAVIREIDVRAAVEIAKRERSGAGRA